MTDKIKIVLFTGGRGSGTIIETFLKHPQIELTCLVNAYDDGLSTGRLREFIPGMLGPSDIRKNIVKLIPARDKCHQTLRFLLDYRFPEKITFEEALGSLECFINLDRNFPQPELKKVYGNLSLNQVRSLSKFCRAFVEYSLEQREKQKPLSFSDASLGNIFFSGCYLLSGNDFNKAVKTFNQFCETRGRVLNITDGKNYVLTAFKEDGTFLKSEAEIVAPQNYGLIADIFLLEEYLDDTQRENLKRQSKAEDLRMLESLAKTPGINPAALSVLKEADIIVYCPGTQHSSLYPSYLTKGVAEAIIANRSAEKVFISNISQDHDIQGEDANSLVNKFFYYMARKGKTAIDKEKTVTHCFFQKEEPLEGTSRSLKYVSFNRQDLDFSNVKIKHIDWEAQAGKHSGGLVLDELLGIIQSKIQLKLRPFHHTASIIVPALNEEKTVKQVLHQLKLLDFGKFELDKEIIFVDGGSSDKTLELAKSEEGVRVYQLKDVFGRGAALRYGIEKAKGDLIIFFPSDNEYNPHDIYSIISSLLYSEFQVVFGSRIVKFINYKQKVLKIYNDNYAAYLVSKYGGLLLSVFTLIFYHKFISDTITGLKGFDAKLLKKLNLSSNGVDLELEIISKISRKNKFILEIPVEFCPRTKEEGKKITMWDGVKALFAIIKYSF